MSESPAPRPAELEALDAHYRLACLLATDTADAASLVEAAHRRARGAKGARVDDMLLRIWTERQPPAPVADAPPAEPPLPPLPTESVRLPRFAGHETVPLRGAPDVWRRRQAAALAEAHLATALALLRPADRVLLVVCLGRERTCADVGPLLGLHAEDACHRFDAARLQVLGHVHGQRDLAPLVDALPEGWLARALRAVVDATPGAPEALREAIARAETGRAAAPPAGRPSARGRRWARQAIMGMALVLSAALLGHLLSRAVQTSAQMAVIAFAAEHADDLAIQLPTSQADEAERFLADQMNTRLAVPVIDQATLRGVAAARVREGVFAPALVYEDRAAGVPLSVFVFSYALLDAYPDALVLAPDVRAQIEEEAHFDLHDLDDRQVLVWRHRDDVFVAVTPADAAALRDRIRLAD